MECSSIRLRQNQSNGFTRASTNGGNGELDLSTLSGAGFGYRLSEIERQLPSFAKITKK
jgi:hypothetical protein